MMLLFSCNSVNSNQELLNKIKEIDRLQKAAKKLKANDSALVYLFQAQKIIDSNNGFSDTLQIESFYVKGRHFRSKKEYDSAAYYFHKAIDLVKGPNNRKRNRYYFTYAWLADEKNNNLSNAISVAQRFIDITKGADRSKDLSYAYNFLEQAYITLDDFDTSLYYNSKTLGLAKKASDLDMYVITGNSKAQTFYKHLNRKKEAFALLDSLNITKCSKEPKRQLYRTYGILQYYEKNYQETLKYFKKVLQLSKDTTSARNNYNTLESYNNITDLYIELEDYNMAEKYLDSTKAIIIPSSDEYYVSKYNKYRFIVNYRTKDDEKELLDEFNALIKENKKQHRIKINEELIALKLANEKEKKATAEKNEAKINIIKLVALLGISVLLLIIGYLFYRQRRYRFEKQDMQMQQRLLRSQMNPHFTFNTLSVIQDQIEKKQDGATKYLLKFSRLLRLILENSLNNFVPVEDELEVLRKYLDLQLLRFPEKFDYNITLENFEEEDMLFIPSMLIQPFIENSIEHGFLGIDYKGQINIKLELKNKYMSCIIEDNGVGLKDNDNDGKTSVSTSLISKFIKKTTKQDVVILDKKNVTPGSAGTQVKFLIPFKLSDND